MEEIDDSGIVEVTLKYKTKSGKSFYVFTEAKSALLLTERGREFVFSDLRLQAERFVSDPPILEPA
jgi:hypothetical protein